MSNYVRTADFAGKDGLASGTALKALKGTELGLEFDNLATMSATKVDSASNASLLSLILTGSTVPSNGIYLPAANTLGFASNNAQRGTIDSAGRWNIPAPSAGTALTINALIGIAAATFKSADGTSSVDMTPSNGAGGYTVSVGADSTGGKINTTSSARDLQLQTNSISALKITTAQRVQILDQSSVFQDAGYLDAPQNLQNANYTFALSDRGKNVHHTSATPHTWSVPDNSSIPCPPGTVIILTNVGTGAITIAVPPTDALVWVPSGATTNRTLTGFGQATLLKVAATTWFLTGANLT